VTSAAAIWAFSAASPWIAWPAVAVLSLAVAAAATAVARSLLAKATGRMITFAKRLGAGDLESTIDGDLPVEMASLGQTLNAMAAGLGTRLGFAEGVLYGLSDAYPFLALDGAGRISHISPVLISQLDFNAEEIDLVGKTPGEVFFQDPSRTTAALEALKQGKKIERETALTTIKGNKRIFRVTANPLHGGDGAVIGSLAIYFDMTKIKEHEQSIAATALSTENLVRESLAISVEVNDASEQLATLITDANADAKRLLESAHESATAMEQMNATVLEVAQNSTDAASMAKGASDKATEGSQTVKSLVERITTVDSVIGNLKTRVHRLDTQADDIGKIMDVIGDIADQTNLLALNAAIEAARAGEAGRGFAVVADEVRKLAEKTMSATGEVGSVISAIQDSVKSAASEMEDASEVIDDVTKRANISGMALSEILELAVQTSGQVHSIAVAAEQQSAAVSQINQTVENTNNTAVHTTESMNKAALSILSLAGRASDLRRIIEGVTGDGSAKELSGLTAGARQKCWEYKKCGREKGGAKVAEMGICPAWPDHGEDCAIVEGTFCGGTVQGDYGSKIAHCAKCDFFKSEHHDRNFVVSGLTGNGAGKSANALARPGACQNPPLRTGQRKALRH
jgi:methyl-accepting chemotaxis protein